MKRNIIKDLPTMSLRFFLGILSGFFSLIYFFDEVQNLLKNSSYWLYISLSIVCVGLIIAIELSISSSIHNSMKQFKDKQIKKGLLLIIIPIPLIIANFFFLSEGSNIIINKQIDKTDFIEKSMNDSLNNQLNSLNKSISEFESIAFKNDTIDWINRKIINTKKETANKQLELLRKEKVVITEQLKNDKKASLSSNLSKVSESKTRYYYFAIGLIFLIVFFNIVSGLLAYKPRAEIDTENEKSLVARINTLVVENKALATTSENLQQTLNNQVSIQNRQKDLFIELIQVLNAISSLKYMSGGVISNKVDELKRLDLLRLEIKNKLGVNGILDEKHKSFTVIKKDINNLKEI